MERDHLDMFMALREDIPPGTIERLHPPAPDFGIHTDSGLIGVEHTRIFMNPNAHAQEKEVEFVVRRAQQIAEDRGCPPVYVYLGEGEVTPSKGNREAVATLLAEAVIQNVPDSDGRVELDWQQLFRLPVYKFARTIHIHRNPHFKKHSWQASRFGVVHEDSCNFIQRELDRKGAHLPAYRTHCTSCWLLIVTESEHPSAFFEPNEQTRAALYSFGFDRAFFLDAFRRKSFELERRKEWAG